MINFETGIAAVCGFCQGFLGFPTIILTPKIARAVSEIWAIPWKERRITNTFCMVVIFIFALLTHLAVARMFIELANVHDQSLRPGKIWALFVFFGGLSYTLVPGIEWRMRNRLKKKDPSTTTNPRPKKTNDKES